MMASEGETQTGAGSADVPRCCKITFVNGGNRIWVWVFGVRAGGGGRFGGRRVGSDSIVGRGQEQVNFGGEKNRLIYGDD